MGMDMRRKVIFVFLIQSDGTILLHEDTDHGPTRGQYIPPHKSTSLDSDYILSEIGYDALNRVRIIGKIRDSPRHVLPYGRDELHYLVADVHDYKSTDLRPFSPEQITDFERYSVASWVPEVMRGMRLIK